MVDLRPRFEYGTVLPRFTPLSSMGAAIVGGPDALWVRASRRLDVDRQHISARWELAAGDEAWIEVEWTPAVSRSPHDGIVDHRTDMERRLAETVSFWEAWLARCSYVGDHQRRVHRSALVLKALTYAPTGAVVAAGTTSLPEWVGGGRNWDYRFTWIRDATLTLASLALLGYLGEAAAFKGWLERTCAGRPEDLQIMYRVTGERLLPSSPWATSVATGTPHRCGSATARRGSSNWTRWDSCSRRATSSGGPVASSRSTMRASSVGWPTWPSATGGDPIRASGRSEIRRVTSSTPNSTAGWPSIGRCAWPKRAARRGSGTVAGRTRRGG